MKKYFKPMIIIILLLIIIFILYKFVNKDNINLKDQELTVNNVVVERLGERIDNETIYNSMLFKNYDEYKEFMSNYKADLKLKESNFDDYDYVLDFQSVSECTEEKDRQISKIEVEESVMNITYKMYNVCSDCDSDKLVNVAYFIPVEKNKLKALIPVFPVYENVNTTLECK